MQAPVVADSAAANANQAAKPFPQPQNRAPSSWLVLGPFPGQEPGQEGSREAALDRDYLEGIGGEENPSIDALTVLNVDGKRQSVKPGTVEGDRGVDLKALFQEGTDFQVAYASGEIEAARDEVLKASFGSDDGAAVWVNGVRIHRLVTPGRGLNPESDHFEVPLRAGRNRVLVKVENGAGGWAFALRLLDAEGEQRARALDRRRHLESVELGPASGQYLLGDSFPELTWRHPGEAAQVFADAAPKARWFDPGLAEVGKPEALGRYIALVEAKTLDGYTHRTMVTFAKVAPGPVPSDIPNPPFAELPPIQTDFFSQLSEPQRAEVSRHFWHAFSEYMRTGENAAIARSALAEAKPPARGEPAWLSSGFIANTEQQLALRMKLEGRTPKPLAPPAAVTPRAPELRAGGESDAQIEPGTVERLRTLSKDWLKQDPNGFVVLAARNGVVFMHEGFGGFKKDQPFWPASIGKMIAGLLFGRAVDQGLVGLDDPVSSVFPDWKGPRTAQLTFRHCFNHLSGFGGHASHRGLFNPYLDSALLVQDSAFVEPLRAHRYNGDNYNLTGQALELITGKSIWRLLSENLQQPFGEPVTQFDLGFGARFTARYLAKVGQMLLQDGRYGAQRFYSSGFLTKLRPERVADHAPGFPDKELEWGIGQTWMFDPSTGKRQDGVLGPNVFGHGAASGSIFRVDPDHQLVVVIGRDAIKSWGDNERFAASFMGTLAKGLGGAAKPKPPAPAAPAPVAARQ